MLYFKFAFDVIIIILKTRNRMLLQRPSQTVLHLGLVRNISGSKKEPSLANIKKSNESQEVNMTGTLEKINEGNEDESEVAGSPKRTGDRGGSPGRSTKSPSKSPSKNIWNLISSELRKAGKSKVSE